MTSVLRSLLNATRCTSTHGPDIGAKGAAPARRYYWGRTRYSNRLNILHQNDGGAQNPVGDGLADGEQDSGARQQTHVPAFTGRDRRGVDTFEIVERDGVAVRYPAFPSLVQA